MNNFHICICNHGQSHGIHIVEDLVHPGVDQGRIPPPWQLLKRSQLTGLDAQIDLFTDRSDIHAAHFKFFGNIPAGFAGYPALFGRFFQAQF
jgi:hypothetical protein